MDNLKVNKLINKISANVPRTEYGTHTGADGLQVCNNCNTPTQCRVEFMGKKKIVNCICKCESEKMKAQQQQEAEKENKLRLESIRKSGFSDLTMIKWTFANDNGANDLMDAMKKYCANFNEFKKDGRGLLLYGNVGTGKTYAAACIANELMDAGNTVLMTNFSRIINKLQNSFEGRQEYLDKLNDFDLLIIDDLAAERQTEYVQEIIFNIIDSRYRANKPLIVTTNLTIEELKQPDNVGKARTFDRILEKCFPVEFKGVSQRRQKIAAEYNDVKNILGL